MGRYVQSCDLGGAFQDKKRTTIKKSNRAGKRSHTRKFDVDEYDKFYKKQLAAFSEIFRRGQ